MDSLKYRIRENSTPHGKPRVYFCCHPMDFAQYFKTESDDILDKQDCVVWYADNSALRDAAFFGELKQMQLFVMPVTNNLLCCPNEVIDAEFKFAIENHIPVLPVMQESDLEHLFAEKYGKLQFLDKHVRDNTEVSYDEKLRKYLESVLVGDKLGREIRTAFDAYIFLSYRRIDRKYALELMREIHKLSFCRNIAVWYPPREESKAAVADAKRAGIKPIMITGDHKITATAIARQIGIFEDGDMAVTGVELDAMSEEELDSKIEKISVYARVSPENKIQIVNAWQRRGNIVAMTGDGVNDAPALKKADIGVAMGITGTEVSKDAAAMILTDDNFATIIKAVTNGRNVYRNIKNAIKFLLSGNMAGILSVLYTSILGLPVPFAPVHLLFMNLLTDSLPAIAIGMEPAEDNLLNQKPRDPKEGILSKEFMLQLLVQGGLIAVCTMAAFHIGLQAGDEILASTMAFSTLTLARLFHGFNCRSEQSIFRIGFRSNPASLGAFGIGVVLLLLVLVVPFLSHLFAASVLTVAQYGIIAGLAFIPTVLIQLCRVIRKR